jgi:hypothetical protein
MNTDGPMFQKIIDNSLLPFMFKISEQPMLYRELLKANKIFDDGLKLEGKVPGVRIRTGRTVLVFAILWHIFFVIPGMGLFHDDLMHMDCHLGIILAIIFTGLFFFSYFVFKEWVIEHMAELQIRNAWKNHFTHFDYDLHHQEVTGIYSKAIEEEIPNKELQLYILNNMISDKK